MNPVFASLDTTIFETMSQLARQHGAVNLGQGFPDDPGPLDVRQKAADAVLNGWNQYPPSMGLPELREAIAAHYDRHHGIDIDASTEVMVTSGATEALGGALLALIEPGDEVVLFEPMYDAYLPIVLRAGGIPRFVTLKPPHWQFTEADLAAAFSSKTRVVVINTPLNPSGTVFPADDLALLARYCLAHDVVVIADEVWEQLIYDGAEHVSLLTVPGMRERTVKVGSAGKMFSLTGWKVGFVVAAPHLLRVISKAHQFLVFTTPPALQVAVAYGLGKPRTDFEAMRAVFQRSRDRFSAGLIERGFTVLPAPATYFVNVDLGEGADDMAFCLDLVAKYGVAAIPVSTFYATKSVRSVVRFCFAKTDATLDAALERLPMAGEILRDRAA